MPERPRRVLEALEDAARKRSGGWLSTWSLVEGIGINFKAGIIVLQHKRDPLKGLGFEIGRKPDAQDPRGGWLFRLESYPLGWIDGKTDLSHIEEERRLAGPKPAKAPKGQLGLFGRTAGRT